MATFAHRAVLRTSAWTLLCTVLMTQNDAASRLMKAEQELQRAQKQFDGSLRATEHYRAARRELEIAEGIARAILLGA